MHNFSQGPNLSTFCFLQGLCRSNTEDQDIVAFPSVKEHYIFTKYMLASPLAMITSHNHFPSAPPIILLPQFSRNVLFSQTHTCLPRKFCPHLCTISDTTVRLFLVGQLANLPNECRWIGRGVIEGGGCWVPLNYSCPCGFRLLLQGVS